MPGVLPGKSMLSYLKFDSDDLLAWSQGLHTGCRYETEEDPEVCSSMERIAGIFMSNDSPIEELHESGQAPLAVS